jgi:hypothetical protein
MNEDTPYPITMQPQFTYEPGGQEWLWVIILVILAISIVTFLSRKRRSSRTRAYQVLLKELDGIRNNADASVATRSSSIIKRSLQLYFPDKDFLALSASEVEDFLRGYGTKDGLTEIHELSRHLTTLEHSRFSGDTLPGTGHVDGIARLIRNIMVQLQNEEKKRKRTSPVKAL